MTATQRTDSSSDRPAVLSITDSTFSHNKATSKGGGLSLQDHVQVTDLSYHLELNSAALAALVHEAPLLQAAAVQSGVH